MNTILEKPTTNPRPLVYLACPYSNPDPQVMEARFEQANRLAAELISQGFKVFSPISHSHPIHKYGLPASWEFWRDFDFTYLALSHTVIVLCLPGWKESVGVQAEIAFAVSNDLEVVYRNPV